MGRFARRALLAFGVAIFAGMAHAQEWRSTDVGNVGMAGGAAQADGTWTVRGSGADVWGTSDAFQFLHRPTNRSGFIVARIADFRAASPLAKAGLMIRAGLDAQAATVILDLKPDGGIEFMARATTGAPMQYLDGTAATTSTWLRLGWTSNDVTAWTSADGSHWTLLRSASVALPVTPETGVAVTSHDNSQLATAHIDAVSIGVQTTNWASTAIGAASGGSATSSNGLWTIAATGADIWGAADSFEYLHRSVVGNNLHIVARIDDLQNTNAFAKAGVMLRASLDASAPAVILDVTPSGYVEFMARTTTSGEMTYLAGATVTAPVWLELSWSADTSSTTRVTGAISSDRATWTPIGATVILTLPNAYEAGVAVTSHDARATTAHVDGVSLLPIGWRSEEVGIHTSVGNASVDMHAKDLIVTVEGAGSDVWGTADAFQFVELPALADGAALTYRVVSVDNTSVFAKAGVMFRDGLDANASSVILDAKPDGGVEFMARLCGGCATTYLGGARVIFPAYVSLRRQGATFTAQVFTADPTDGETIGSVTVAMAGPTPGFAVTSHDPSRTTTAIFDNPSQ